MTGLIYVAIIAVWAVVLVPAWLRRHDHLDPERSVDRFTRSMQTLAARPSVLGIPMPSHEEQAQVDAGAEVVRPRRGLRRGTQASSRRGGRGAAPSRRGMTAAARRRIVLAVLGTFFLAVAALVIPGIFSPLALAVPAVLIVGFLALARRQVRAARQARRVPPKQRPTGLATAPARPAPSTAAPTGSTWEAQSTPLPTYVTAPPAAGYPRAIDQGPGAWTAAAMLERAQKQKDRAERMAAAKAEAIARARAEQEAAQVPTRDDDFLSAQAVASARYDTVPLRGVGAVNE